MGMMYNYGAGFASSISILSLSPQLALGAKRMSPASLAGSIKNHAVRALASDDLSQAMAGLA
jgi:hypothetical protein